MFWRLKYVNESGNTNFSSDYGCMYDIYRITDYTRFQS